MAKGASIKFKSYEETIPKLLELLNLQQELKKYDKIVLKPFLTNLSEDSTPKEFVEAVLKFCLENKNPVADVFIAEGADGEDTNDLFQAQGYTTLAEKYPVSLVDINEAETLELQTSDFLKFPTLHYPSILKDSFLISLPKLTENEETEISGSLANMLGAFSASKYRGFFSQTKNKIRKWPIKYSIHDILRCKMPDFAVMDASPNGAVFAGLPLEIDKQAAKFLGKDWQNIPHIKLIAEEFQEKPKPDEQ